MENGLNFKVVSDLKGTNIEDFLECRGITNPEKFLHVEQYYPEIETNVENFHSMNIAIGLLHQAIENDEHIGVLVDDDADGFSSSASLIASIMNLRESSENIEWFFHEKKSHGLTNDIQEELLHSSCDLIIIPDAASNDFKMQKELLNDGKKLIILDHHEIDNQEQIESLEFMYSNYALVNNHLKSNKEVNPHFVGAGMVYKFIQAYDKKYGTCVSDYILDLVAMGQIGDASDIADLEIRALVNKGLSKLTSPLLIETLGDKENLAPINLSFSIIPMVNAVTRVGDYEEKDLALKALMGYWSLDEKIILQKRRKNKITNKFEVREEEWTMYQYVADLMTKIKARQNKTSDKMMTTLSDDAFTNGICITTTTEEEIKYRSITGLIANKLTSKFKMPALVLVKNEKDDSIYNGSARGFEKEIPDFRAWCLESGFFELAQGHDNAFGVEITRENLELLKNSLQNKKETNLNNIVYDVDKLYENKSNLSEVKKMNDNEQIFGGSVKKPLYGYKGLMIKRNCVNQRGSVVTFFHDGLEFIAYKQDPGIIDEFLQTLGFAQEFMVDLVGEPSRNNWNGRIKEQIVLEDFAFSSHELNNTEDQWIDEDGNLSF